MSRNRAALLVATVAVAAFVNGLWVGHTDLRHKCVIRSEQPVNPRVEVSCESAGEGCVTTYTYEK